tara:strand:- start:972 stop:2201 length:1230 start_codon:yes stop_codon:yes gene_type:complete
MIKKLLSNRFARGSFSLFIMFNIFNLLSFIFQFSMARLLGPAEFGVFAVLISLVYFVAIPSDSVQTFVAKYSSKFKAKGEIGKIKSMTLKIFYKGLKVSLITFVISIPLIYLLAYFLDISFLLVFLTSTLIFSIFLLPTTRGLMQGMQQFNSLGMNMIVEGSLKLVFSVLFVLAGMKVYGAIVGLLLGIVFAFVFSLLPLGIMFKSKKEDVKIPNIYRSSSAIILVLVAIMGVQSIDIIVAKKLFSDIVAGQYAVLNLMGKIIFFGTIAISKVMLPISSEKFENGGKTRKILIRSLVSVGILSLIGLCFYGLFPELIISVLFGSEYLAISDFVFLIGIAFTFISLSNIVLLYGVAVDKKIKLWQLIIFLVLQLSLLISMGDNLQNYSIAMIVTGIAMFFGSLIIVNSKR